MAEVNENMYEIDKRKSGTFIAMLRKEKGWTQKELAQQLFISDKAVSKWETGASIPDTAMLIPLAELLEVSTTELLLGERMERKEPMDAEQVDDIVRAAISYAEERPAESEHAHKKWALRLVVSALVGCTGLGLCMLQSRIGETIPVIAVLGVVFGAYFCFIAQKKLPAYYDENRIGAIHQGAFRMNVPGLVFNNRNWPHIVHVGRVWACALLALYPCLSALLLLIAREWWMEWEKTVSALCVTVSLIAPMYYVGKKYE